MPSSFGSMSAQSVAWPKETEIDKPGVILLLWP